MDDKFKIWKEKLKNFSEQHAINIRYWEEHSVQLEECKEGSQKSLFFNSAVWSDKK